MCHLFPVGTLSGPILLSFPLPSHPLALLDSDFSLSSCKHFMAPQASNMMHGRPSKTPADPLGNSTKGTTVKVMSFSGARSTVPRSVRTYALSVMVMSISWPTYTCWEERLRIDMELDYCLCPQTLHVTIYLFWAYRISYSVDHLRPQNIYSNWISMIIIIIMAANYWVPTLNQALCLVFCLCKSNGSFHLTCKVASPQYLEKRKIES